MPKFPLAIKLAKSDRRAQWAALKSQHKQAIAAKKIDFGAKFGAALDKYQLQLKAADKLLAVEAFNPAALDKVLAASRPLSNIADHYLGLVKGLGGPAEKELTAFLKGVIADAAGWEQMSNAFEKSDVPVVSPAQLAGVKSLYGPLDRLSSQLDNLGKSLAPALAELKALRNKGVKPTANQAKMSLGDWATLQALAPARWSQLYNSKLGGAIASATALTPTLDPARRDVLQLLNLIKSFDRTMDYVAFKERAQTAAASSLAAFQHDVTGLALIQTDPELVARLGLKALGGIQNSRATSAIKHGRDYVDQTLAAIHQLP